MPTFRDFVALGVGTAIALIYTKPSASQDLPSPLSFQRQAPTHQRDRVTQRGLTDVAPPSTEENLLVDADDDRPKVEDTEQIPEGIDRDAFSTSLGAIKREQGLHSPRNRTEESTYAQTSESLNSTSEPITSETEHFPNSTELAQDSKQLVTQQPENSIGQTPESIPSLPTLEEPETETPSPDFLTPEIESVPIPSTTPDLPISELLNPSANPLLFPTEVEEVQVQTTQPITLEQAIELARRNNQELQIARLQLERTEFALQEALAAEFPSISAIAEFIRTESETGGQQGFLQELLGQTNRTITSTNFDTRLELNYAAYTAGRRPAAIQAAEQQVRFQQLGVESILADLRLNVTRTYYDLQQADAEVEISQAAVNDAARSLRDAQLLEQAGLGTRFEVLQAQVELANNNQALTNAISQQRIARRQIAQLLSLDQQVGISAADPIDVAGDWELSLEESIILALKNRAELEQQLAQRNINEQQRRIALADNKPQVNLFAQYNISTQLDDSDGPTDGLTLGARLQWNFFDGGAAKARARQAEADVAIAESNFANERDQIRLEVEQAFFQLTASQENIQTASFALEQAQESLRLARLRFGAGVGTQTDVINQQTALTRSRVNLLTAILDYNRALATLQRAISNLPNSILFDVP
ncbi:outer membrane efflux protein [Coleofasciculus chthonoplastes PCC 7420]|uniref:Outer membrane efflux protein n=1 Tax=Coleofasciculus chthonoplastes PCC 7420 TaxID=118168 RepID=B4VXB0_9CYAN|nr:TolC family protein [Coleofasciculus chthonoplastes]EDX73311.1 outer membrane efflux protein [Coleofasciculus chthonoplastes PCC 7420]